MYYITLIFGNASSFAACRRTTKNRGTSLWENLRFYSYFVIGTALLELRCWNYVVSNIKKSQTLVRRTLSMKSPSQSHLPSASTFRNLALHYGSKNPPPS